MNRELPEAKSNELVHSHAPKRTQPHEGHGGTRYEGIDASAGMVIWSLAIIGGTLVFVFAITIWIQRSLQVNNPPGQLPSPLAPARIVPPNPVLQVHPWEELPGVRAHEDQVLNSYGKDADGHVHIPITSGDECGGSHADHCTRCAAGNHHAGRGRAGVFGQRERHAGALPQTADFGRDS